MTKILIPVSLTFSKLNEAGAALINTLHGLLGLPLVEEGADNPYTAMLADLAFGKQGFDRKSPMAESSDIDHPEFITVQNIALIVALGGDVIDLPVYFVLATDPATTNCPLSTTTPQQTWAQWGQGAPNTEPVQIGSVWYRSSADYSRTSDSGKPLNASQWVPITRNYTITVTEFQQIQSENQSLVP
jgi:hypothetical protein